MRSILWLCALGAAIFLTDFSYWQIWDHAAASRERSVAFSDTCSKIAADFDAQALGAVRPRAYEQSLGILKKHPLTQVAQCTQVRGRCEVGYVSKDVTSASWQYDARFVARPMHHCIFPVTLLQGVGGMREVELME
ncbi:hypothetical protein SLH49_16255 [Cognatiyoonia sp. IB215446]|uniref:hypothetical protein n=1 Tax=Cognatiyoonia sp. IB215446 TaxID=3097355 RepID=UPI002A1173E0|nr:hypothetical protein [Cognatiyoonia sp. IB215446]MDX8349537.1 hypothetical protein [Cognatiyoonia sp. IB215446]